MDHSPLKSTGAWCSMNENNYPENNYTLPRWPPSRQTLLEGLWLNHLIFRLEFICPIELKLSTVGSRVAQRKSICSTVKGSRSLGDLVDSNVNHRDTNQSQASACCCTQKTADSAYLSVCYSAL